MKNKLKSHFGTYFAGKTDRINQPHYIIRDYMKQFPLYIILKTAFKQVMNLLAFYFHLFLFSTLKKLKEMLKPLNIVLQNVTIITGIEVKYT